MDTRHDDVSTTSHVVAAAAVADWWWVPAGRPSVVVVVAAWDERVLVVVFVVVGWPGDVPIDIATPWREVTNYTRFGTGASSTRITGPPRTSAGSRVACRRETCSPSHTRPSRPIRRHTPPHDSTAERRVRPGSRGSSPSCCARHVPTVNVVSNTPPLSLTLDPAD